MIPREVRGQAGPRPEDSVGHRKEIDFILSAVFCRGVAVSVLSIKDHSVSSRECTGKGQNWKQEPRARRFCLDKNDKSGEMERRTDILGVMPTGLVGGWV